MIVGNAYAYSDDFIAYEGKSPLAKPDPDLYGLHALYRLYEAREGWIFLAAPLQSEWEALASALGLAELLADERFADPESRTSNDGALIDAIGAAVKTKAGGEWESILTEAGVGCAEVFPGTFSAFCSTDAEALASELVVEVEHPVLGGLIRHGPPVRVLGYSCTGIHELSTGR